MAIKHKLIWAALNLAVFCVKVLEKNWTNGKRAINMQNMRVFSAINNWLIYAFSLIPPHASNIVLQTKIEVSSFFDSLPIFAPAFR